MRDNESPDKIDLSFEDVIPAASGTTYHPLQLLGAGGNADTWLMLAGSGPRKGFLFAVKIFRRVSKPERRESFIHEMKFLRECDYPGIMRTFDEGIFREDHPFVVAEYLPQTIGNTIRARSSRMVEKLSFMLQLLSTLEFLATLPTPVVHRDIKPQNVFVKGGSCVLGDFGLMKRLNEGDDEPPENVFKHSVGPGMPFFYRTPDQVSYARNQNDLTVASDVFQLGLLAAELFTGRNPERRAEYGDFLSDVKLEPLRSVPGGSGILISDLIQSMLEMLPSNRPNSGELLERWKGIFFDVATKQRAIEGRVL